MALFEQKRLWQSEQRFQRRKQGLCPVCGIRSRLGKIYCQECADKDNERQRKRGLWKTPKSRLSHCISAIRYRNRVRNAVLAAYGNKCACCGETEPIFLELDHIFDNGADERETLGNGASFWNKIRRAGFPKDYRLLCSNCNKGRYKNGGICPHEVGRCKRGVFE